MCQIYFNKKIIIKKLPTCKQQLQKKSKVNPKKKKKINNKDQSRKQNKTEKQKTEKQ